MTYKKGPDVMSKALRTQRRYKNAWKGQTTLDGFVFTPTSHPADDDNIQIIDSDTFHHQSALSMIPQIRQASPSPPLSVEEEEEGPTVELRGKPQSMRNKDGKPKGVKSVLEERGFDVKKMKAKCKPVCPAENTNCCMARLLSNQDDFKNQVSTLEVLVKKRQHEIIFLPKFHCELNPIEMVCNCFSLSDLLTNSGI